MYPGAEFDHLIHQAHRSLKWLVTLSSPYNEAWLIDFDETETSFVITASTSQQLVCFLPNPSSINQSVFPGVSSVSLCSLSTMINFSLTFSPPLVQLYILDLFRFAYVYTLKRIMCI
jgi:hypothetical protein